MGMMRYVVDYNGMRYTMDAPEGTSASTLQAAITSQNKPAPAPPDPAAPPMQESRKRLAEMDAAIAALKKEAITNNLGAQPRMGVSGSAEYQLGALKSKRAGLARNIKEGPNTGLFGDIGSQVGAGLAGWDVGLGYLTGDKRTEAQGRQRQAIAQEELTARGQEVSQTGVLGDDMTFGDRAYAAALGVSRSVPDLVGGALLGAGVAAVAPEAAVAAVGARVLSLAAKSPRVAKLFGITTGASGRQAATAAGRQVVGTIAGSGIEGVQAGLYAGSDTKAAVLEQIEADPDAFANSDLGKKLLVLYKGDMEAAKNAAAEQIGRENALATGIITSLLAIPGSVFETRLLRGAASGKIGKEFLVGTAAETIQEGPQSGAEQALSNLALQRAGSNVGAFEGVAKAAGEGAIIGGLMGGTLGGGSAVLRGKEKVQRSLGDRAAANRDRAFELVSGVFEPLQEFDINVGSPEDPSQLVRQRIQILTAADAKGNVIAVRPDGTRYQASLSQLESNRVPTEGIRAIPIPETLSRSAIAERLTASLGGAAPDGDIESYIKTVTTTLNNSMAMGMPESAEAFLQKQQNSLRKSRISEESRIARMLVLDEAAKVQNDYLSLVTAPPAGAATTAAPTAPTVFEAPPVSLADTLAAQAADRAESKAQRDTLLSQIASTTDIIDKPGAFADALASAGISEATAVETGILRDVMRTESEAETAAGQEKDTRDRQRIVERMDIIEPVLFDDRIPDEKKAERISVKLRNKGFKPLNRRELERLAGYEAANSVYGPEGEYTQRRQALLDQAIADPTATDKYRAFAELLDQYPELGDPTPEETRALRGDVAELETQIAPSEASIDTVALPAEPGGLLAEFKEAPTALEAIDAQIAVEQVKLDAAPNLGAPAARRAINAIKALEAERTALPVVEETPVVEEAAPVIEEAPVVEETPEPTEAEQVVHIQLTEGEKEVLADHYEQPEYNDVAKSRFIQDLVLAINNGLQAVSKKIRGIVRRIQVLALATSVVFNANPLTTPSIPQEQAQAIVYNETLHRAVPTAARGEMSAEAQRVYELMAPVAIKTGKSFFIADKPNGMIHAFAGNGSYMVSAPSLYGKAAGDVLTETRTKAKAVADVKDSDRITPAGTYRMEAAKYSKYTGGYVLYLNNPETGAAVGANEAGGGAIVAVHSVYTKSVSENRQGRLDTATSNDNKVSFGCINTAEDFFLDSVLPNIESFNGGMVFVMPDDVSQTDQYFTGEQQQKQQPSTPQQQQQQQQQVGIRPGQEASRQARGGKKRRANNATDDTSVPNEEGKQTINNPEEDVSPAEERLENEPGTIENAFPASVNRPRAEAIGFAADMQRRVKSRKSRVTRAINYKYQTASDYSKALAASYGLIDLPADLNVARRFEMFESRKIGGQMQLNRWYFQPIEDLMKKLGLSPQDVGVYLWARSAPARNTLVRKKNGTENGSGLSDAEAKAKLDQLELEGLGPALREVATLHDSLVDYVGRQRVKAGLLSKKEWEAMRKAQPFYTPLKGYALDGDMQVDGEPDPHGDEERGIAQSNGTSIREVISARGRESMPFDPLANLMSDAQFAIARIEQNKVKVSFLDNVLSDPKSHEGLVKVYTPKKQEHSSGLTTLPKMGPNGPVDMNRLASQKNPSLMLVKKDGKQYYVEFARTPAGNALYRAFANLTPLELGKFMRNSQAVANTLKSFKTRYNPIYIGTTAWMRDFNEAILTAYAAQGIKGGPAEGTKLGKKTARYIASLSGMQTITDYLGGRDPTTAEGEVLTLLFDQFLEDGGAVGHAQIMEAEALAQDTAKRIKRYAAMKRKNPAAAALMAKDMLAGALDTASQTVDLQARFATYRAALEEGLSRDDAASLALDSSLNLTRRGEWAPYLDVWSFFACPSIEGGRKLLSQGRYSTIARKLFVTNVMAGALIYLFNRFGPGAGDEDEDGIPNILEVNNATAQSRLILRYGPGVNEYVAVPVAFGMGFFNYTGGQVMATILGDISPTEAGVNIVSGLTSMTSPIKTEGTEGLTSIVNFIVPDPVQPLWDLVVNRTAFGSKIYTDQGYQTTPKSELGREETGEAWKFIARGLNSMFRGTSSVESWASVQPEQFRYVTEQLLGGSYGLGRDTVNLFTEEPKKDQSILQRLPFIKTLMGRGGEYAPMNKFYDSYDLINGLYAVYNNDDGTLPEDQAENVEKYPVETDERVMEAFGGAQSEIRTIRADNRDGAYETEQEMHDALNEVYMNFNKTYGAVKEEYANK